MSRCKPVRSRQKAAAFQFGLTFLSQLESKNEMLLQSSRSFARRLVMSSPELGYLCRPHGRVAQVRRALPDFLNTRGDNRCPILRVTKLQVHSPTDEAPLQQGTSPSRACDCDHHRLRAVLWMPRNQHGVVEQEHSRIAVVLGLNLEHGIRREILKKHSSFNFRLHDTAVYFVAEVGMRREGGWCLRHGNLPF